MIERLRSSIEVFKYPASSKPFPEPWAEIVKLDLESASDTRNDTSGPGVPDPESEEVSAAGDGDPDQRGFVSGREQGIREGREAELLAQSALLHEAQQRGAEQAANLANQFAAERDRFLRTVEQEVVKLALAIAARVLRREAQTDPLFLVGAVRVALGQLARTLQVRVRVPASEASLWIETFEHLPNLKVKPTAIPDESMNGGDCAIETDMGSVDLGLPAQLYQIESALFDGASAGDGANNRGDEANRQEVSE